MNTNISRRHVIGTLAASPLIAAPVAALADTEGRDAPDPVFAAIAAYRAEEKAINESLMDVDGRRFYELTQVL